MPEFNWDDPSFRTSPFIKFDTIGQKVSGCVREVKTHTFEARGEPGTKEYSAAKTVPVLVLDTPEGEQDLTCSNADLLEQIIMHKPQVGDSVHVEYLRDVSTSFGGKKKLFHVKVERGVAPATENDIPF